MRVAYFYLYPVQLMNDSLFLLKMKEHCVRGVMKYAKGKKFISVTVATRDDIYIPGVAVLKAEGVCYKAPRIASKNNLQELIKKLS